MAAEFFNGALTILRLPGMPQPELSPVGNGYIYFDISAGKLMASEDGGMYVTLVGGPAPDARVFRWDTATSWSTIYAAILAHGGTGIVMVEPDVVPRVMTAGATNLDNVTFIGEPISPDTSVAVDMDDGVTLGPGGGLRSKDILWRSLSTGTRIIGSGPPCSFEFDGGGMIGWTDPGAFNPIRLDPGGNKIRLTNSAVLSGAGMPPGNPLIVVSGGGSLDITALAGSSIGDHTLGGGLFASATVASDASVVISPTFFAGFIGVTTSLLDAASRVTYDDSLAPPPLGVFDVQAAIDALKTTNGAWTLDPGVVRLTTVTDQVGIGTAAPAAGTKLNVVGDSRLEGNVLIPPANQLDTTAAGSLNLGTTNATSVGVGNAAGGPSAFQAFFNQGGAALHGSNAGLQFSSTTANRGACRFNQYGSNAGVPGITGFKSRGTNVGDLASCSAGDVLFRATAIGVAADNASIGLAATVSISVPTGGVGGNYLATDFEVSLTPLAGPINGRKQAFLVDSEGVLHGKESANCFAGVATLGAAGTVVVPNTRVTATTKFLFTAQDGGPAPTGVIYQSARTVGANFTIASSAGAGDAGVVVYYQLWEPTIP